MRQGRLDVAVPKIARQRYAQLELTAPPGPAAEQTLVLALLHLAGYHQLVAVQIDIDVLAPHTRKLDLDDIRAVVSMTSGPGNQAPSRVRPPTTDCASRSHLRIEILELAKRAPLRLTSRTFHGQSHVSSSSNSSAVVVKDCAIEAAGRLALARRFQGCDFTRRGQSRSIGTVGIRTPAGIA